MSIPDAHVQAYLGVFRNQHGSGIPVFQGLARYQSGQGIGDFFRGILRRVIPVALNVAKSALSAFSGAQEEGASIKDALRATLKPATQAAIRGTVEQITKAQEVQAQKAQVQAQKAQIQEEQKGQGKRRKRKGVYKRRKHNKKKKSIPINYNF